MVSPYLFKYNIMVSLLPYVYIYMVNHANVIFIYIYSCHIPVSHLAIFINPSSRAQKGP